MLALAERQFAMGNIVGTRATLEQLITNYPAAPEGDAARALLVRVEAAEAEAAVKEKQRQERRAAALKSMRTTRDDVERITWYQDTTTPRFTNADAFYLYFGVPDGRGSAPLRLRVQYEDDSWLFVKGFTVVADGQRFDFPRMDFKRDNNARVWEWCDEPLGNNERMIAAIVNSEDATLRLVGQQYHSDRKITQAEKTALMRVTEAHAALSR